MPKVATRAKKSRVAPTRKCRIYSPKPARPRARSSAGVDQGDAEIGALAAAQMRGRLDDGDFQRRPHDPAQEMAAARRAVPQAHDGMHVQAGLAVVADRDVAQQAQAFALLVDLDRPVSPGPQIEPADGGALEGAERCQRGAAQLV